MIHVVDITLETVAPDTPNNVADIVTAAPAEHAPMICHFSKSDKASIFSFFHMGLHSSQSLMH
jgi:hypothetical protein